MTNPTQEPHEGHDPKLILTFIFVGVLALLGGGAMLLDYWLGPHTSALPLFVGIGGGLVALAVYTKMLEHME